VLGIPIPPEENLRLVMGRGKYVDDIRMEGALYLGVVRSPYAHAKVVKVDVGDAARIARLTILFQDLQTTLKSLYMPAAGFPGVKMARMPVLAIDKVNFVGQPVAAIVCDNQYILEDALELVSVDYEPLKPVLDPRKALDDNAPLIHPDIGSNICIHRVMGGDVTKVFEEAEVVIEDEFEIHRVAPIPMEPRAALATYDNGTLTLHVASQGVFIFKQYLLENLLLPENNVKVVQSDVGGAFGSKTPPYPEHLLVAHAAMKLGRPVKWVESRRENLIASSHSRDLRGRVSVAAEKNGRIRGVKAAIIADIGAYAFFVNPLFGVFTAQQITGPYDIRAAYVDVKAVYTNKTPTGPYRGFSRPEAAFLYERAVDMLADHIGLDPAEVRIKNLVRYEDMPHRTPLGLELDPEDYHDIMGKALKIFDYWKVKVEVETERKNGRMIGLGLANYIELNRASFGGGESALARLEKDGSISISTGAGPHGQGLATILRQLAAWELGVTLDKVRFLESNSDLMKTGVGTFGSRSTVISGEAVISAVRNLKHLILEHASSIMGLPPSQLRYYGDRIIGQSIPSQEINLVQVAERAGPVEVQVFVQGKDIFSYGVHLAVVEIDKESGAVKVLKYMCVDDAGKVVNPLLAEGQVIGAVAQAVGQVFHEEIRYDANGQPQNVTISDVGVPTSLDIGSVESILLEFPSQYSHGARGIGEAGTIGGLPTLVRAVENAINRRVRSTNLKYETLWHMINNDENKGSVRIRL
jgi:carbon-monoxide dehydrogenase large subunit